MEVAALYPKTIHSPNKQGLRRPSQKLSAQFNSSRFLLWPFQTRALILLLQLTSRCSVLGLRLSGIIRTTAVIKVANLVAVKSRLLESLIDNVVRKA